MAVEDTPPGERKQEEERIMATTVKPIPEGYHTVTSYLIIKDAAKALEFYKGAFGATEHVRLNTPDGKVMHAESRSAIRRSCCATNAPTRTRSARGPSGEPPSPSCSTWRMWTPS